MINRWLIVGLGNPGKEYLETRHNAGFILLDEFAKLINTKIEKKTNFGLINIVSFNNSQCILLKPQDYMNNSGDAVYKTSQYYNIPIKNIIVLHDDTNFKIGKIKIKQTGSSGGHKGINSIIESLNDTNFIRIKIGVNDKPNKYVDLKDWVVSKFSQNELNELKKNVNVIFEMLNHITSGQISKAMNKYNGYEVS